MSDRFLDAIARSTPAAVGPGLELRGTGTGYTLAHRRAVTPEEEEPVDPDPPEPPEPIEVPLDQLITNWKGEWGSIVKEGYAQHAPPNNSGTLYQWSWYPTWIRWTLSPPAYTSNTPSISGGDTSELVTTNTLAVASTDLLTPRKLRYTEITDSLYDEGNFIERLHLQDYYFSNGEHVARPVIQKSLFYSHDPEGWTHHKRMSFLFINYATHPASEYLHDITFSVSSQGTAPNHQSETLEGEYPASGYVWAYRDIEKNWFGSDPGIITLFALPLDLAEDMLYPNGNIWQINEWLKDAGSEHIIQTWNTSVGIGLTSLRLNGLQGYEDQGGIYLGFAVDLAENKRESFSAEYHNERTMQSTINLNRFAWPVGPDSLGSGTVRYGYINQKLARQSTGYIDTKPDMNPAIEDAHIGILSFHGFTATEKE